MLASNGDLMLLAVFLLACGLVPSLLVRLDGEQKMRAEVPPPFAGLAESEHAALRLLVSRRLAALGERLNPPAPARPAAAPRPAPHPAAAHRGGW